MATVSALIPCSGLKRHNDDWQQAIRTLLAIPHDSTQFPYVNATYSAILWLRPEVARKSAGYQRIVIPASLFPEFEGETPCAA